MDFITRNNEWPKVTSSNSSGNFWSSVAFVSGIARLPCLYSRPRVVLREMGLMKAGTLLIHKRDPHILSFFEPLHELAQTKRSFPVQCREPHRQNQTNNTKSPTEHHSELSFAPPFSLPGPYFIKIDALMTLSTFCCLSLPFSPSFIHSPARIFSGVW